MPRNSICLGRVDDLGTSYIFLKSTNAQSLFLLSLPTPSFSLFSLSTCLLAFHNLLPLQALRNLELVNVLTSNVSSEVWLFRAIKIIILGYRRKIHEVLFVYSSLHPFKFLSLVNVSSSVVHSHMCYLTFLFLDVFLIVILLIKMQTPKL